MKTKTKALKDVFKFYDLQGRLLVSVSDMVLCIYVLDSYTDSCSFYVSPVFQVTYYMHFWVSNVFHFIDSGVMVN